MIDFFVFGFLILGAVFNLMGLVGILLFPDPYTRLQASSTCSTTAVISIFIAVMLEAGFSPITGKVLVITLFFFISSPVSAHIIARYAWQTGIVPWRKLRKLEPKEMDQ
ncbi:MAG: monovalent cation/H(+) antiporter subunit G [Spirochaetales bacterium]